MQARQSVYASQAASLRSPSPGRKVINPELGDNVFRDVELNTLPLKSRAAFGRPEGAPATDSAPSTSLLVNSGLFQMHISPCRSA